jgi:outer membrane receptor protein involved in Fe transport
VSAAQYAASVAGHAVNGVNPIPQCIAGQCSQLTGGNTALKPEQGETYTVGINFQPSALPKFTSSVDYYHINVRDVIGQLPYTQLFTQCANTGDPAFCNGIVRNSVTGGLTGNTIAGGGYIVQTNLNLGSELVSGIDVQFGYQLDLPPGLGNVRFDMNGTYVQHILSTPVPGGGSYECAGLFGATCQTVNPRWHHIFRTTWSTPWDISASATWRFLGSVRQDGDTGNPLLANTSAGYTYDAYNAQIGSYSYLDLEVTWHPTKILTLRVGANNVLDKDPPLLVSSTGLIASGAANTSDAYDIFGRQLFASFTAKF